MKKEKLKIVVVSGGPSTERDISLKTGKSIFDNLDKTKYEVAEFIVSNNLDNFYTDRNRKFLKKFDLAFIALHGYFGEDGKIQSFFDSINISYTGSGSFSSSLSINKYFSTEVAKNSGFNVPKTFLINKSSNKQYLDLIVRKLKFPFFLKPNNGGSSDGAGIIKDLNQFKLKLNFIFKIDKEAIAQELILGRELTCGVLGNTNAKVSAMPPVEIPKQADFFDRKVKYSKNTVEICPAKLSKKQTLEIKKLSEKIHKALFCDCISRSDFILKGNKFYYLETNSLPGMTSTSLVPKEANAIGISFSYLLDKIISFALEK